MKKKRITFRMIKMFCALFLLAAVLAGQCEGFAVVKAAEAKTTQQGEVDFASGEASITVKGNASQSLVGKKLYLYRLFDIENAQALESLNYTLNEVYAEALKTVVGQALEKETALVTEYEVIDYMQSLGKVDVEGAQTDQTTEGSHSAYRYFAEDLLTEIHTRQLEGTEIQVADVKEDNSVLLTGLPYGYYMLEDATEAVGTHAAVSMSMMTNANPTTNVNFKADYPTISKVIKEDDNQEEVGESGWNNIGDYEIGQGILFRHDSVLPNISGYDTYYYAWHDDMDEALTLDKESLRVSISGKINGRTKLYVLSYKEYNMITDLEDMTFKIEIEDIKAIVDREFYQGNTTDDHAYGERVYINYRAYLNDEAILAPGRPGFENSVRLEFSNNPNREGKGETGFTPWDSVVCFTYHLEGVKVNNKGEKLEGAEFKLYYDKECSDEVYIKQVEQGYSVVHKDSLGEETLTNSVNIVSDEEGRFSIYGLDSGVYYLKEESAPDGYREILDPIEIRITATFPEDRLSYVTGAGAGESVLNLTGTAYIKTFVNGVDKEEEVVLGANSEDGKLNLSVVNEVGRKLPITGSYWMPMFIGTGILLMVISLKKGRGKHD